MRTLILTGPATDEQRAVSQALKAAFAARGDSSLSVGALALLGQHAPLSLTGAMENEALSSPRAFAFLLGGDSFRRAGKRKSVVYEANVRYLENLGTLLREGEFDAVLCLHRYPAEAVSQLRKTIAFSARCCFVPVDFAVVPFLEETTLDLYFTAHANLTAPYCKRGFPEKKIVPVGIPLPESWFRSEDRADARALLSLPQQMPCFFISSAEDAAATAAMLLSQINGTDARVCVVQPVDLPARNAAQRQATDIRLVPVDPDDEPTLYRNACDVLLSLPCGAASAAAANAGVPLVHLPPGDDNERQTARFFHLRGMGESAESLPEAIDLAIQLAKDKSKQEQMRSAQHGVCPNDAAAKIVHYLHEGHF